MIKQLTIQNFQSHKLTTLHFDKGVNVITGSSDHGKSAIIKALRWLIWNKPMGDEFRNWDGGDVNVSVELEEGITISRIKKGSENFYKLDDLSFTAFGADVPSEIQKAFNLSEINLQQQLNMPFLLTETPGNVAKHFSKVAKIDKINSTEKRINSEISKINLSIDRHETNIKQHQLELEGLPNLTKIEAELEVLEDLEKKKLTILKNTSDLNLLIRHINTVESRIEEDSKLLTFEKDVSKLLDALHSKDSILIDISNLTRLSEDIEMVDYKVREFNKKIQGEKLLHSILSNFEERRLITADVRALKVIIDKIYYSTQNIKRTQENAVKMETRFKKEFPHVCPLCGTPKKEIKI
jgi:DNA repair protein SbcC/Rad50